MHFKFLISSFLFVNFSQLVLSKGSDDDDTTTSLTTSRTSTRTSTRTSIRTSSRTSTRTSIRTSSQTSSQTSTQTSTPSPITDDNSESRRSKQDRELERKREREERKLARKRERELEREQRRLQRDLERSLRRNQTQTQTRTLEKRAKKPKTCPVCKACQKCDAKRGVCVGVTTFETCTSGTTSGICYAGVCNTKVTLPVPTTSLPECKTYRCPRSGTCSIVNAANGLECGDPNADVHSYCLRGQCTPFIEALNKQLKNVGCWLVKDNTRCDTNEVFTDTEVCVNNVCVRPGRTPVFPGVSMPSKSCTENEFYLPCTMTTTVSPLPFDYYCVPNQDGPGGTCQPFLHGLTETAPHYNTGCEFMKDGTNCDTNEDLEDGETCLDNVCVFPDGSYEGLIPGQALSKPKTKTTTTKTKTTTTKASKTTTTKGSKPTTTKTKSKTTTTTTKKSTRTGSAELSDKIDVKFETGLFN